MTSKDDIPPKDQIPAVTPELLLEAYCAGYFPMAMSKRGRTLYWFNPEIRAVLPLQDDSFHISRTLRKLLRNHPYTITVDTAFSEVMRACADTTRKKEDGTWINKEILALYGQLHDMGFAHSVEVWEDKTLIGGLYGVSIGAAFFGESMFSLRTGASKIALVHLVERLKAAEYQFLDAQFENPHLVQFGFQSVPQEAYHTLLRQALSASPKPSTRFLTISV
ncbi:MAG: leucyl/phenylalanyl-tRNA--protein transferase [Alphaproteobacteria bacterium]|nr:leucyl/phenylalanyl-tRNA--protein transferase [Alphaproteobacteria bacterium]